MAKKPKHWVGDDPDFKVGCVVLYWRRDPGQKPVPVQASVEEIDGDMVFVQRLDNNEERYMPIARFVAIVSPAPRWEDQPDEPEDEVPF